jgi:hypothetical protein
MLIRALILICFVSTVQAAERRPVDGIKPLLIEAVTNGEAHGYLVGEAGAKLKETFKTDYPMEIDIHTIAELPEAGCKRVRVASKQRGVVEPKVKGLKQVDGPDDKTMVFDMNFCEDGSFPKEAP